jgi:VanZ like protein
VRRSDPRTGLALLVLAVILGGTLWPEHGPPYPITWCIACGERGGADAVRNFLLFIPLGFFASGRFRRALWAVAACAALSLLVETLQQWIPGRDPSASDLLFNAVGAAVGVALARSSRVWLRPSRQQAAWLTLAWAALPWAIFATTGALQTPLPPPSPRPGPTAAALVRDLFAGLLALNGTAVHGAAAPVTFRDLPRGGGDYFGLSSDGDDLVLTVHTRAAVARLDEPNVRWRGVLRGFAEGDVPVSIRRRGAEWCVRVETRLRCGGATAGSGWGMILFPDAAARRFGAWISAAWLLVLFAPLGFRLRRGRWETAAAVAGCSTLVVLPTLGVLASSPPLEWFGAGAGVLAGALLAALAGVPREPTVPASAAVLDPPARRRKTVPSR